MLWNGAECIQSKSATQRSLEWSCNNVQNYIFVTVQERFMAFCRCREAVQLFKFLMSPYNMRSRIILEGNGVRKSVPVPHKLQTDGNEVSASRSETSTPINKHREVYPIHRSQGGPNNLSARNDKKVPPPCLESNQSTFSHFTGLNRRIMSLN
jgi:hypothetical protein